MAPVADGGLPFRPVARAPLSLLVYHQLREAIVSGGLADGVEVPSEKELTRRFGVSRSTVREALRVLQAQGFLTGGDSVSTSRPRVSTARTVESASEALESAIRIGRIPLGDLVELRLLLETAAVAKERYEPAELASARDALELMQRDDLDIQSYIDADIDFHISLAGSGGNAAFRLVMIVLRDAVSDFLREALEAMSDPVAVMRRLTDEHDAIFNAVTKHNIPRAQKLIRAHIWEFYVNEWQGDGEMA
jgi:GntR family transcriptional regulator, transcriptional repressor for pyruvate dehydrogenase complex